MVGPVQALVHNRELHGGKSPGAARDASLRRSPISARRRMPEFQRHAENPPYDQARGVAMTSHMAREICEFENCGQ